MGIPSRPDDVKAYIDGATKKKNAPPAVDDAHLDRMVSKTLKMRMRWQLMLDAEAHKRTQAKGKRVTLTDVQDAILAEWASKNGY